jgi:lysophospholipase L1-like esterase
MSRRTAVAAVLATLAAALVFAVARPALSATTPVKIMPLGDSITGGPGCWRALLWDHLQKTGFTNIDFVGTLPGGGCSVPFDGDNEGHGGIAATGMADQNQLPPWLAATTPDIVLMHLGTNDLWGNIPTASILTAYGKLVDQMRASNPNMKILVAQIIPMNPPGCANCATGAVALDNAIPGWAAARTTAASPITVVDQWTGFDTVADTIGDGVHPNDSGFQKIADRWYPPLTKVLGGTPPSPSPSRSAFPAPSTSPGGAGCSATYTVVSQWSGGFQGEVTVKNGTAAATAGWTASFSFTGGQQVTQSWNATVTQNGAAVTARNMSYNGGLAAGAATAFGFLASSGATNPVPAVSCTLG